ncbi:GNAT family N-acetyltransferase [Anaerostipes sp.]|uniref:GNAT family N-acetyltransferase n=1 Tax=Anaerostipes sp. TaxID=1872530 RepID=UPI0025C08B9E|nr:GNAT family N-acetyltransferase [Anaerostipes sp.]MBS7007474.1 N-acetyltransferase [Anaerostipes sp.]
MEFQYEEHRIFAEDEKGKMTAEITFPEVSVDTAVIDHTFVDNSLRGQGVAGKLVEAAAEQLAERGMKVIPTCSYAVSWFQKHPEYQNLLKNE